LITFFFFFFLIELEDTSTESAQDNLITCGKYLQSKFVNLDASHIVDGKLKLILGLIWTLILHYSISLPMWEFDQPDAPGQGKDVTPKQKLMNWIQEKLPPELPISNFTSDWNDGRAIGALVDACAPGMFTPRQF
jgi:filamin